MAPIIWAISLLNLSACDDRAAASDGPSKVVVVVAAPEYRPALEPWLERRSRQGYQVDLVDPVEVLGANDSRTAVELIRDAIVQHIPARIRSAASDDTPAGGFVLLVGDAPGPAEPLDVARLIPTSIETEKARPSAPHRFASDNVYGLPDERGVPRLAVGRWPVRSPDEVAVQVRKSLRYETDQRPGPHRRDITFLATTPNYNPALDPVLEKMAMTMISSQLGPQWGIRALYSSPNSDYFPGPEATSRQVVRWIEEATPVTLFAGHGFDRGVDLVRCEGKAYRVLDSELAATVQGDRPGTLLWMSTCSCGDFDLPPPHRGLGESLMMNPRGPTAVFAGSDETSAYANTLLCLGLAQVIDRPPATLGEAVLRCKRSFCQPGPAWLKNLLLSLEPTEKAEHLPEDHEYLYNLLGDPTLPLRLPRRLSFSAKVVEEPADLPGERVFTISGKLDDWDTGRAVVSLMLDRLAMKERVPDPLTLPDATARRDAFLARFGNANDKTAAQGEATVQSGRFELRIAVPESLAERVRWLQLYVSTERTRDGEWSDGVGSHAVRLAAQAD